MISLELQWFLPIHATLSINGVLLKFMGIIIYPLQIVILFLTITIHEFSHGMCAYLLGDDTAKRAGRLTLNPISHIDIMGAIMLFVARFGWAKPVPVNPNNFTNPKIHMAFVGAAGPAANFIMAMIFSVIYRMNTSILFTSISTVIFGSLLQYTIFINLGLGLFNLLPIPPLDGSRILGGFLSDRAHFAFFYNERKWAAFLMLILMLSFVFKLNIIGRIITPPITFFFKLLTGI